MILISHRGNINGINQEMENFPDYIDEAIKLGYDVEVDVWYGDGLLWIGHDEPQYGVNLEWFNDRAERLWIHCKNLKTVEFLMNTELHYFFHVNDPTTITSDGFIWQHPDHEPIKNSISVLPEINGWDVSNCLGVCSDYIGEYR